MPLLDHFRDPVKGELPWDTLHSSWASEIARALNLRWLTQPFRALEHTHIGPLAEIDVGTFEHHGPTTPSPNGGPVATLRQTWTATAPVCSAPLVFPDTFEVRVYSGRAGWDLVGAIELISPSNKDDPAGRRAFLSKCASYLHSGVSVVLIDVVTDHHPNLHNELLELLGIIGPAQLGAEDLLYAAAYRPVQRGERSEVDVWRAPCRLGAPLPTLPLRLARDLFVPIEFEATYQESCRVHWL